MINREAGTPRSPIAVEPLESRLCLSSPVGGDLSHHNLAHAGGGAAGAGGGERHAFPHRAHQAQAKASHATAAMESNPNGHGSPDMFAAGTAATEQAPMMRTVINLPGVRIVIDHPMPIRWQPPMIGWPGIDYHDDDIVGPKPDPSGGGSKNASAPRVASAPRGSVTLVQATPDATDISNVAVDAGNPNVAIVEDVAATGPMLATATGTMPAAHALATSAGSVIDRLTSTWHDSSAAATATVVALETSEAVAAQWLPAAAETFVAAAVDAAGNLLAPVAETASSVVAAVTPMATAAAYEIAHMGSPFALLADSLANFVEESATVTNVVAQAKSRGPWALTAGVIAADVVILTYVYRRKSTRRRVALAPVGVV
jgi:hypothetical protein